MRPGRITGTPRVARARRAMRVAGLKLVWGLASVILLSSALVEWTQPHPSGFTFLFVVAWGGVSVWAWRAIRRARA